MFTSRIYVVIHWLVVSTIVCAPVAKADYQTIGPAAELSQQSIQTNCSYRFNKRLFSRNYYFFVTSLVTKPAGMEVMTFSADPFIELRSLLSRDDLGMLLADQQQSADWVLQPTRFADPELRVVFGVLPGETKAFVSFSTPDAEAGHDLPRTVPIDPHNLALEQQCVRPTRMQTKQGRCRE